MIRAVSTDVVHNITSGQVVVDLLSVVKELLENALDAGSKSISISIKSHKGIIEYLEIQDNGSGIPPDDFENLALKNYTSKLRDFEGLSGVSTLGFRGEALNSIANMANLEIKTSTEENAPRGYQLLYDHDGKLTQKTPVSHPKGTTIRVSDLFEKLPVRQLNLQKNYKRELQRMLSGILPYFIISNGVRIIAYHLDNKNAKKIMLRTNGNKLIKDNLINVFSSTGLTGLEDFEDTLELMDSQINVNGLLSNSSFGSGRSSRDRQFVFINNRPVDWKPLLKLSNETYKKFNYLQSPVLIINFTINSSYLDINVTPDKRIVMLDQSLEVKLLEEFALLLDRKWDHEGNYNIPVNFTAKDQIDSRNTSRQWTLDSYILSSAGDNEDRDLDMDMDIKEVETQEEISISEQLIIESASETNNCDEVEPENERTLNNESESPEELQENSLLSENNNYSYISKVDTTIINPPLIDNDKSLINSSSPQITNVSSLSYNETAGSIPKWNTNVGDEVAGDDADDLYDELDHIVVESSPKPTDLFENERLEEIVKCKIDFSEFKLNVSLDEKGNSANTTVKSSDLTDLSKCERQLTLNVNKKDFLSMEIIGQFNKGFIVTQNPETKDIFIVDQHASDEKFNFERIIANTKINSQRLVIPELLELNSIDKLTISTHLPVFEKNGFQFKFELNEETQIEDVYLAALPSSKATTFTISDLHELIHLLQEAHNPKNIGSVRPSKVRSMFAMRACRSSIMIGQPLSVAKMNEVVKHLSELDKPWNCPHGRPTMRHLVEMKQWRSFHNDYQI